LKGGNEGARVLSHSWVDPLGNSTISTIQIWKKMLKQSLGIVDFLKFKNVLSINYNKWFSDKEYRKSIATSIGFKFTDCGIMDVVTFGGGSSFDGLKYNSKAQKMNVLTRWKDFAQDNTFNKLVCDKELEKLNNAYFGRVR
jgi:hypothetical protein